MILKKAIVYDFSKKLLSLNSLEMNKLTMNGEILNFRPNVTFPSLRTADAFPVVASLPPKNCKHIHRTRPCEKSRELVP